MSDPMGEDERFASALSAVASPVRLRLLRALRAPRTLSEIEIQTTPHDETHARTLSRQAVKFHLDLLVEAGVVLAHEAERDGRTTIEYALNHQRLYVYSEEFRELARIRPEVPPALATTVDARQARRSRAAGPRLVIVKGADEGRTFELGSANGGKRHWIIGRRTDVEVCVDFDPFVSAQNAVIETRGGSFVLRDLEESRNGTRLNFEPLPTGASAQLAAGDVVGVGRTLLLFRC